MFEGRTGVKRAVLVALLAASVACRTTPIQDVIDAPLPAAWSRVSLDAADEAIWRAGRKVDWEIERLSPGVLRGTWRFKHYTAVVTISHDRRLLSIRYEESDHLLHGSEIHSNYQRMVERLLRAIRQEPVAEATLAPT